MVMILLCYDDNVIMIWYDCNVIWLWYDMIMILPDISQLFRCNALASNKTFHDIFFCIMSGYLLLHYAWLLIGGLIGWHLVWLWREGSNATGTVGIVVNRRSLRSVLPSSLLTTLLFYFNLLLFSSLTSDFLHIIWVSKLFIFSTL